ncbi:YqaJ viral recombinase family protein [Microbacterium arabinogalactanolyticum]|uniref:YqaJ viral recombinase family protein n=1 Tax=Microbacterium arabinogalactanolyticum TaxID=69365 RepID=UPI004043B91F
MTPELEARIIADSRDRVAWLRARARGITATDVAGLSGEASIIRAADAKLGHGPRFGGNAYTDHGRRREPEIAAWVAATHGILPSSALFRAEVEQRHLATPDGVCVDGEGRVLLAEIKTTNKSWATIPRTYLRQVWWQQYVLGAERTLFVWEEHVDFQPIHDEPKSVWIERDDKEIGRLVALANRLIDELYHRTTGQAPPARSPIAPNRRDALRERDMFRALALSD